MRERSPLKLGSEFWLSLLVLLPSLYFTYAGIVMQSGRNIVGSLLVAGIFLWRAYSRFQQVRLARLLLRNPQVQRIYDSTPR